MTKRRQSLGREGEHRAADYLEARGYRIVARNVRASRVEIDLIAQQGGTLAFIEVKTRRATDPSLPGEHGRAAEAVDERKQARLRHGAQAWLTEHPLERRRARRVRFDVVTCLKARDPSGPCPSESDPRNDDTAPGEARWSIEHWKAAF